jgi:hypothetical protein
LIVGLAEDLHSSLMVSGHIVATFENRAATFQFGFEIVRASLADE